MTRTTELAAAEAALEAFEAELWAGIGLEPDGDVAAHLTDANFMTLHRLDQLRERVSLLAQGAAQ